MNEVKGSRVQCLPFQEQFCPVFRSEIFAFLLQEKAFIHAVEFISDDSVFVNADKDAIYQVMYNLCHNAIKFADEKGMFRICIEEQENDEIRISVADGGQEIASEDIPFVFDRFYKTDKSRGLDKNGVGLGLYICKAIMDQHKMSIGVSSSDGITEFYFTLKKGAPRHKGHTYNELTDPTT